MMTGMNDARFGGGMTLVALTLTLVLGCSVSPRSDPPTFGEWQPESGEPVDRIRFSNVIDWQPLNRDWVLLRFNGGVSVALRPRDPCMADVREARTVELMTAIPNLLHRSDQLWLDQNACLIEEIRSVSVPLRERPLRGSVSRTDRR